MPDSKISNLTELTAPVAEDELVIVDKSDTTMAATGTTKKVTKANLVLSETNRLDSLETVVNNASSSAPASIDLHEDTDNGTNKITITAPSAVSSDKTITLPDVSGTLALLEVVYPVGSVYTNKTVSTNPATLFGFGTWVAIAGRVVVGLDAEQTEFDTAGETGGEKTHLLTSSESGLPAHKHTYITPTPPNKNLAYPAGGSSWGIGASVTDANSAANASSAHNNLQPYVVCYVWERTA